MYVEIHCLFPSSWSNRQNSASVPNKTPRQAIPTAASLSFIGPTQAKSGTYLKLALTSSFRDIQGSSVTIMRSLDIVQTELHFPIGKASSFYLGDVRFDLNSDTDYPDRGFWWLISFPSGKWRHSRLALNSQSLLSTSHPVQTFDAV